MRKYDPSVVKMAFREKIHGKLYDIRVPNMLANRNIIWQILESYTPPELNIYTPSNYPLNYQTPPDKYDHVCK
eukprot:g83352.t1